MRGGIILKKEQTGIEPVTLGPAIPRSTTELLFLFESLVPSCCYQFIPLFQNIIYPKTKYSFPVISTIDYKMDKEELETNNCSSILKTVRSSEIISDRFQIYLFGNSIMRGTDMAKSIQIRLPNFQKDVIIPQIYDLENIKLIQSCNYRDSPQNKVVLLKKKAIQSVVNTIINKQKVEPSSKSAMWKSRGLPRPQTVRDRHSSHSDKVMGFQKERLFMEIDEDIGEMIALNQQNFAPFAERVKSVLSRVNFQTINIALDAKKKEVEEFINSISGKSNKYLNPQRMRPISGLIDQINELQQKKKQKSSRRAQSARLIRNHSQDYKAGSRLMKSKGERRSSNLRKTQSLQDHINKSKQIINMINETLENQTKTNKKTENRMKSMQEEWKEGGILQKTFVRSSNTIITPSALEILREKRLKTHALTRIDNEYMQK